MTKSIRTSQINNLLFIANYLSTVAACIANNSLANDVVDKIKAQIQRTSMIWVFSKTFKVPICVKDFPGLKNWKNSSTSRELWVPRMLYELISTIDNHNGQHYSNCTEYAISSKTSHQKQPVTVICQQRPNMNHSCFLPDQTCRSNISQPASTINI